MLTKKTDRDNFLLKTRSKTHELSWVVVDPAFTGINAMDSVI